VDPRTGLDNVEKDKLLYLTETQTPNPWSSSPSKVAIPTEPSRPLLERCTYTLNYVLFGDFEVLTAGVMKKSLF
jgi:hypothetical protein